MDTELMDHGTERRIAAPRERVWQALASPATVGRLLPGCDRLAPAGQGTLDVTLGDRGLPALGGFVGTARVAGQTPPERARVAFEGRSPRGTPVAGEVALVLIDDGPTSVLRASVSGTADADAGRLLAGFLDALVAELAGLPERPIGADGAAGVIAAATRPAAPGPLSGLLAAIPPAPLGFPIVAWIGGVIYLGIFVLIFSSYVF